MRHAKCVASLLLSMSLLSACSSDQSKLEPLARQLHNAVDRCLSDVRDRHVKYESSQYCRALTKVAQQYVEAGGLKCPFQNFLSLLNHLDSKKMEGGLIR